jgi:hypothetical protein
MKKTQLSEYWDGDAYRFPTLVIAMQYVDEMTDDDEFYLNDPSDRLLFRKIEKVFG